ncbi:hypothetical protein AVEN_138978-1 [Araneus ventricosus]|uniref:Uncharacterized protein n=1 Tax=Araneus ventricosus TaxID=182803 RepID=A0A4Y2N4B0_ARAVE|nr:hypothetical protein AVEN_138978-1 [Araneus ventricosus]
MNHWAEACKTLSIGVKELREDSTDTDEESSSAKEFIYKRKKNLHYLQENIGLTEELSIQDDIIYKGDRIVIPSSMRTEKMSKAHQGHLGINA